MKITKFISLAMLSVVLLASCQSRESKINKRSKMKITKFIPLAMLSVVLLASCQSRESKINKLVTVRVRSTS